MHHKKIAAIITMLAILLAMTAVSGCTTGSMSVSPTPTVAPTVTPTAEPTVAPVTTPTATVIATPVATPAPTPVPSVIPTTIKTYPTMGPWTPGDDTFIPTPTADAGYAISSPWVDQKIQIPVTLKITGNVNKPLSLGVGILKTYPMRPASFTNSKNKTSYGFGPEINALLNAADPKPGATSITLIASDGVTYDISLSDVRADSGAIVSIESDNTLRSYFPSMPKNGKAHLRGLIEIRVN